MGCGLRRLVFATSILTIAGAAACSESNPANPSCTVTVSMPSAEFGPAGGTASASVAAPARCTWSASSSASWITFQGAAQGAGDGALSVTVAAYDGAEPRTGSLTIASQRLEIRQSACDIRLGAETLSISDQGGTASAQLNVQPGCRWAIAGVPAWIVPEPSSGQGAATISLRVAENNDVPRQAALRIGPATLTIDQNPEPCNLSLTPPAGPLNQAGGEATIQIGARAGCRWELTSDAAWVKFIDATQGAGSGSVRLSVEPHTGAEPRRSRLAANGASTFIEQSGSSACHPRVTPVVSPGFRATGGRGEVTVTAEPGCSWTARAGADWLHIVEGASGTGSGRVVYDVDPDLSNYSYVVGGKGAPIEVRWAGPAEGENHRVTQFLRCPFFLDTLLGRPDPVGNDTFNLSVPAAGGEVYVSVLVESPFTCHWTIVPESASWMTLRTTRGIAPDSIRGDGQFRVAFQPNPSSTPRSVSMLIVERRVVFIQAGR